MSVEPRVMRAAAFLEFGGPQVIEERVLPAPLAGPGEVLVRVSAATVNPTDLLMRAGLQAALMGDAAPPYVAGMEFAGHVEALGQGAVGPEPGTPVMGIVDARRPAGGAYAELIAVPAASVVPVPEGMDLVRAATIPMNGLTAAMAIDELALQPGGTILVTGGAGALGGYVVQLARVSGLRVIADAHEVDAELLADLGADDIVPRGEGMVAAVRRLAPEGVDGAVDAARIGEDVASLVRDRGVVVGVRSTDAEGDSRVERRYVSVLKQLANTPALRKLAELAQSGALSPRVAVELPLEDAAVAHGLVAAGGLRGRVVLVVDQ